VRPPRRLHSRDEPPSSPLPLLIVVFKTVFGLTVLVTLGAAALVTGRFLGLIDVGPDKPATAVCDSLGAAQRKALVGTKTPYAEDLGSDDRRTCRWTAEEGEEDTLVEVTSMSASRWVVDYARDIASPGGPDGPSDATSTEVMRRALELGTQAGGREACALATKVFELEGAPRGATELVSFQEGGRKDSPRMVAQACTAGTFTTVLAAAPDLKPSSTLERRAGQALADVQERLS
jgi:hypothetical protein